MDSKEVKMEKKPLFNMMKDSISLRFKKKKKGEKEDANSSDG